MSDEALEKTGVWRQWWRRLAYTPLKDWTRGRLTAGLDLKGLVARSDLPEELKVIVYKTARRARLWRGERIDAAQELINHFTDGLQAGRSAAELRESFGDWKIAARLIARAKRRARPMWLRIAWPIVKTIWIVFAVLIFLTGVTVARYLLVHPIADTSLTDSLNERARNVAEADRAWPLYNLAYSKCVASWPEWARYLGVESDDLDSADRDKWIDYVRQHQDIVQLIREAAAKPRLGFYFRNPGEAPSKGIVSYENESKTGITDPDRFEDGAGRFKVPGRYGSLYFAPPIYRDWLLPVLWADALSAAEKNDSQTAVADIQAMKQMADHCLDGFPVVRAYQARFGILLAMFRTVGDVLAHYPQLFSNEQLQVLSRLIGSLSDKQLLVDYSTSGKLWKESRTHCYAADGFLTEAGIAQIRGAALFPGISGLVSSPRSTNRALGLCIESWLPFAAISLNRVLQFGDQFFNDMRAYQDTPLWERTTSSPGEWFSESFWSSGKLHRLRWDPAISVSPWEYEGVERRHQEVLQMRDAMLTLIALELYHRANGQWPKTLDGLVPEFLPAVPPDRFDGKPLKYALRDGQPVLYSVGSDRIDDGGVAPKHDSTRSYYIKRWQSPKEADAGRLQNPESVGDWILWPPQERIKGALNGAAK